MKFTKSFLKQNRFSIKPVIESLNEILGFGYKASYIEHVIETSIMNKYTCE